MVVSMSRRCYRTSFSRIPSYFAAHKLILLLVYIRDVNDFVLGLANVCLMLEPKACQNTGFASHTGDSNESSLGHGRMQINLGSVGPSGVAGALGLKPSGPGDTLGPYLHLDNLHSPCPREDP